MVIKLKKRVNFKATIKTHPTNENGKYYLLSWCPIGILRRYQMPYYSNSWNWYFFLNVQSNNWHCVFVRGGGEYAPSNFKILILSFYQDKMENFSYSWKMGGCRSTHAELTIFIFITKLFQRKKSGGLYHHNIPTLHVWVCTSDTEMQLGLRAKFGTNLGKHDYFILAISKDFMKTNVFSLVKFEIAHSFTD